MAGTGPAPKDKSVRRGRNPPARGEWFSLPPVEHEIPKLPPRVRSRGRWSTRTKRAWQRWWTDRASTQWNESEFDQVEHLADLHEEFVREPKASLASEIRQNRDSLGLTLKGKQDRRWLVPAADADEPDPPAGVADMAEYRDRLGA